MMAVNQVSNHEATTNIIATVNGEKRELPAGHTVGTLLETLGIKPDRVAVEFDRRIVKPADWAQTQIRDGSEIEIVHFVGGGAS